MSDHFGALCIKGLIVFYIDVNIEIKINLVDITVLFIHKSIKQPFASNQYYERKKIMTVLILISNGVWIEEKLCSKMNLNVNICDKAKFIKANFIYYDNNEKDNLDREKNKKTKKKKQRKRH